MLVLIMQVAKQWEQALVHMSLQQLFSHFRYKLHHILEEVNGEQLHIAGLLVERKRARPQHQLLQAQLGSGLKIHRAQSFLATPRAGQGGRAGTKPYVVKEWTEHLSQLQSGGAGNWDVFGQEHLAKHREGPPNHLPICILQELYDLSQQEPFFWPVWNTMLCCEAIKCCIAKIAAAV